MNEFYAGAFSGLTQSIIGYPLDTIKILLQSNNNFPQKASYYYKGISYPLIFSMLSNGFLFQCNNKIYNKCNNNYVSGIISGTLIAPAIFFVDIGKIHYQINPTKKIKISQFKNINGIKPTILRESIGTSIYFGTYYELKQKYNPIFAGGIAGLLSWTVTYPIDVIKTRQMTHGYTIKESINIGNLWKGFMPCAIRAVIVNAVGFWSYELYNSKLA